MCKLGLRGDSSLAWDCTQTFNNGKWISTWMSEWMSELVSKWVNEWVTGWMNERNERVSMSYWVSNYISEWVSDWLSELNKGHIKNFIWLEFIHEECS